MKELSRKKILGLNIKQERIKQGLSQVRLSVLANISVESVQKIEYGKQTPSILVLLDIAKALNVSVLDLLKDLV